MKIDLIIAYIQRYTYGHEKDFVPPLTGIHLAALVPAGHTVRLLHQQIDEIPVETDADLVAISFFSGFAPAAYKLAEEFRKKGKTVVAGGPHVTYAVEESLVYFDAVVTGEAEDAWPQLIQDVEQGELKKIYKGGAHHLQNIPTPRYDLLSDKFFIKKVIQATRGCPFSCSFCTVPSLNPGFRMRPVQDVIRDAAFDNFPHWWQRKVVWFWDDNLTINRKYIKELLPELKKLNKWWLTQASIDITKDDELLDLMKESGCIGIFLGIESFDRESLADANKKQNKITHYKKAVKALHKRGITVMAGFIAGFDHDTRESVVEMADNLMKIGIDVPFLSIMTPFRGTALYQKMENENRMLTERDWSFYNGYNVTFKPNNMSPEELLAAHRQLWKKAFSFRYSIRRMLRGLFTLRGGALLMSLCMNGFYCLKRMRRNYPADMARGYKWKTYKPQSINTSADVKPQYIHQL
ncbi:MAG TPA: radical SAM protein [Flavobacteriales bacterium]|nr:radical SAM protein [Flavobacteriales bacterium]